MGLLASLAALPAQADDNAATTRRNDCICKSMVVRGANLPAEKTALGPTGDGTSAWPVGKGNAAKGDDGKTLGPLKDNPANPNGTWVGYSFEVVTTIEGNPAKCKEIQLTRASGEYRGVKQRKCEEETGYVWDAAAGVCRYTAQWTGNVANTDKAGKPKIDIQTEEACDALKGIWENGRCILQFPYDGATYGPDAPNDKVVGGAYESARHPLKRHLAKMIIWKDKVSFNAPGADSKLNASVLPVVQGTDGKFCFAQIDLNLTRTASGADEKLNVKDHGDGVGKDKIP